MQYCHIQYSRIKMDLIVKLKYMYVYKQKLYTRSQIKCNVIATIKICGRSIEFKQFVILPSLDICVARF